MSGRAEATGCDSGTLVPTPARGVSSNVSGRAEAPGCDFGTLVPDPARGVSIAWPGLFTRGLPPCGSSAAALRLERGRPAAQARRWAAGKRPCNALSTPLGRISRVLGAQMAARMTTATASRKRPTVSPTTTFPGVSRVLCFA
ncbi:MAG: hypothetical protein RLZZ436_2579 [Planctomycetota bacterium]